jgi:serine/threonine-protein kinase
MSVGTDPFMGAKLGSYEIIEAIGEGGMARIYKGFHAELNRFTAIKVINWGLQEDPEFTERFRREAQAIAILRHPNIVQIFDFGKHTSGYFMVMEFIDGSDLQVQLREYHQRNELLPKDKVMRVIREIAAALDYAHGRGVIHRDVKPSNIMLTREGQSILTDFGLVMLPAHKSQATIGNTFGTPHYVAPEQAISSAAAVAASDIYSLGVILYEMATGQLPFDDESPLSVALKHISDPPPPPTSINPTLPSDVEDVILQALAKDPSDRFATAGDMASALEMSWSSAAASRERKAATMLPAGVPPAAVVPSITLPNVAAVAPVSVAADLAQTAPVSGALIKSPSLLGWWPLVVGGVAAVLIGGWSLFSFINSSPAQPATPTIEAVAIAVESPTATSTFTPQATPASSTAVAGNEFSAPTPTPIPPSPTATPTPVPTATPEPTATSSPTVPPTATPTATLAPTETAIPTATATSTTLPTATAEPLPTATPTSASAGLGPLTLEQLKGKILFKTDRAGYVQIYRMEADGSNQLPLDDTSLYAQLEADLPFSANKQERMVVRGEGQLDLWRANLVTSQELRVTSTGKPEYDAAWSPVDNRIAYVSEETGNGDIYMLNLDGSAVERLTVNTDNFDKHPTWSPDGTKIAFWSDMGFNKTRQIWLIDLSTRNLRSLSDNPYNDWDPVWVH